MTTPNAMFLPDYGFIDSFSELSVLPLTDISGSSLGYIDSDSSPDIAETMDEATLAQMQVKKKKKQMNVDDYLVIIH